MDVKDVFPPPQRLSPERQERIRSVLLEEMSPAIAADRPRHANRRWRVTVASAVAAAAATVAAVMLGVVVPVGGPSGWPPARHHAAAHRQHAAAQPTARQILFAAAAAVARQHPARYWHFFINSPTIDAGTPNNGTPSNFASDQWDARDGNSWISPQPCRTGTQMPSGTTVVNGSEAPGYSGFGLGNPRTTPPWTYDLVQHWPASPAALKATIATYANANEKGTPARQGAEIDALLALQLLVPAPPQVRAAAYRALATFPGVHAQGGAPGGQILVFPDDPGPTTVVIDPATGLIRSQTWANGYGQAPETVLAAEWTNRLPRVIPQYKNMC